MKKIIYIAFTALFAISVISCGAKKVENTEQKESAATTQTTPNNAINTDSAAKNDGNVMDKPIHLTKADFISKVMDFEKNPNKWVYAGDKPAIIDFWASWCGPCKAVAPILDELAGEYKGKIYVYKVNVDDERELAGLFGIQSIPTLLFIPMKGDPKSEVGALPKETIKERIDNFLLANK